MYIRFLLKKKRKERKDYEKKIIIFHLFQIQKGNRDGIL